MRLLYGVYTTDDELLSVHETELSAQIAVDINKKQNRLPVDIYVDVVVVHNLTQKDEKTVV